MGGQCSSSTSSEQQQSEIFMESPEPFNNKQQEEQEQEQKEYALILETIKQEQQKLLPQITQQQIQEAKIVILAEEQKLNNILEFNQNEQERIEEEERKKEEEEIEKKKKKEEEETNKMIEEQRKEEEEEIEKKKRKEVEETNKMIEEQRKKEEEEIKKKKRKEEEEKKNKMIEEQRKKEEEEKKKKKEEELLLIKYEKEREIKKKEIKVKLEHLNIGKQIKEEQVTFSEQLKVICAEQPKPAETQKLEQNHEKAMVRIENIIEKPVDQIINPQEKEERQISLGLILLHNMLEQQGITAYIADEEQEKPKLNTKNDLQQKLLQSGLLQQSSFLTASYESQESMLGKFTNSRFDNFTNDQLSNDIIEKISKDFKPKVAKQAKINEDQVVIQDISANPPEIKFRLEGVPQNFDQKEFEKANFAYFREMGISVKSSNLLDGAQLSKSMFNPKYNMNWDHLGINNDNRGSLKFFSNPNIPIPQPYYFPVGYQGLGLEIGKYGSDQTWIGTGVGEGVWIVLFHGTGEDSLKGIINDNLQGGKNNVYQNKLCRITNTKITNQFHKNVYLADQIKETEHYSQRNMNGKKFYLIFQCRVNPKGVKSPIDKPQYYTVENPIENIRPYRLLIKEF